MTGPVNSNERDQFFTLSLDLLCIADFDGYFKDLNPMWAKTLGFTIEELKAKPFIEFVHPKDQESTIAEANRLMEGIASVSFENRYLCKDGSYRWLLWSSTVSLEKRLYYAVARDITNRKQAEQALRDSEERFNELTRNIHQVFWMTDAQKNQVIYVSPAYEKIWGRSCESVYQNPRSFLDSVHPADRERVIASLSQQASGGYDEEYRIMRPAGDVRWIRARAFPIQDSQGTVYRIAGISEDITRRKQTQEALDQQGYLLQTLMDNIPDHIYFKDTSSRFIRINRAMGDWFGLADPAEARGQTDFDFFTEEHAQQARVDEQDVMRSGTPVVGKEEKETWPNRHETWVSTTKAPLRDKNGKIIGTFGISRDVTDRKKAEEALAQRADELEREIKERVRAQAELQEAKESAEYANRAKSEFLANMSHELRTPLNAIIGFAEILRDEIVGPISDEQKELVSDVHTSGRHLLNMINDILDLAKIEAGKMDLQLEEFTIKEAIEEVNTVIRAIAAKKRIQLSLEIEEHATVEADKVKFKQILYNLLSNAVKFTAENGHVATRCEIRGREALFRVVDTGIGISPEDQEKLFRPFTQLDGSRSREYSGSGLGLALTRRLVELHGGKIRVESRKAIGSTFLFTLPLHQEPSAAPPIVGNATVAPPGRRTILVAEDDERIAQMLEVYLTEAGYQVAHAKDGEEAIAKAAEIQPFAMTLDIMLPKKDGWRVLKALKTNPHLQSIPVIIISVTGDKQIGLGLGAVDHLVKPIDQESLLASLRNLRLSAQQNSARLLVVDDDPQTVRLLSTVLKNEGYEVATALSGQEAIDIIFSQPLDLIILDLMMPQVDGFQVIKRLASDPTAREIPIVVCTAMDLNDQDKERLNGQIQSIIQKTGHVKDELLASIRRIERLRSPGESSRADDAPGRT